MALVTQHWSGKQHEVVQEISLIGLVWTDGDAAFPCDFRLYNKAEDGLSKNDHFRALVEMAKARGFSPSVVAFDSWYSRLDNLKLVRGYAWDWLTRLKCNRQVSLQAGNQQAVSELDIPHLGLVVHLRGYGLVKLFRTVDPHGNAEYWATSRLNLTEAQRQVLAGGDGDLPPDQRGEAEARTADQRHAHAAQVKDHAAAVWWRVDLGRLNRLH